MYFLATLTQGSLRRCRFNVSRVFENFFSFTRSFLRAAIHSFCDTTLRFSIPWTVLIFGIRVLVVVEIASSESPAARAEVLPRHPSRGVGGEEHRHVGDVFGIADPVEWRHAGRFVAIAVLHHVRFGWAGGNRVDSDVARPEFPRQTANELLHCAFATKIKRLSWEKQL